MHDISPCRIAVFLLTLWAVAGACGATVFLADVDSADPFSSQEFRWLDAGGVAYAASYRDSYTYDRARVVVEHDAAGPVFRGRLVAENLKPNFAYQIKLRAAPGTAAVEPLGAVGRYWREEWIAGEWDRGANLNEKGDGYSPTPNDWFYLVTRDIPNATSPTGLRFRYSTYLLLDYFITDERGAAQVEFELTSSYHVLWRPDQRLRTPLDGPLREGDLVVREESPAYDQSLPDGTAAVFGEWERLPVGGIRLQPGDYDCAIMLTEESFHEVGALSGSWAAAMEAPVTFSIGAPPVFAEDPDPSLVKPGGTVSLRIVLSDRDDADLQWYRNDTPVPGGVQAELIIQDAAPTDEGVYRCVASNAFGETASRAVSVWVRNDLFSQAELSEAVAQATADSDGDGVTDADEVTAGTDPELYALTMRPGWNLVSIARRPADNTLVGIFGAHAGEVEGPAWIWRDGEYLPKDRLEPDLGHWILWSGPQRQIQITLP
jgi:hypothetical protein